MCVCMQACSNVTFRTSMQQLTRFQLTCGMSRCPSVIAELLVDELLIKSLFLCIRDPIYNKNLRKNPKFIIGFS